MADDKKFDIEIGTSADTSGLDAVERQLKAVAAAGKSAANPMADGSQLRAGAAADPVETARETTQAIEEQAEALADLTDEQAGVIDATRRLNQEAAKPDGFNKLFTQQRLIQIASEFGNLARTVGEFATEFAKTEAGKELLSGLSAEAQEFGGTLGSVASSAAAGFAAGGPVGGAIAATTALVKRLGDSFLEVQRAEEAGAAAFERTQAETMRRARERQELATDRAIAETFAEENRKLDEQNQKLDQNARLLGARQEEASAKFDLSQEQQRAAGTPEAQLRAEKIRFDAQQEREKIRAAEMQARYQASIAEREANVAAGARDDIGKAKGTDSPEFAAAAERARAAAAAQAAAERDAATAAQQAELQRSALEARTAARLQAEARQAQEAAARDTQRRAEDARRQQEDADRTREAEARRRQQLGREGEGIADGLIGGAANGRQQAALEQIGNRVAAGGGLDELTGAIERMLVTADEQRARQLRSAMERIARLEAKLKAGGDAK
jgi:hypothetical protein